MDTIDDLLDTEVAAILEDTGTTLPAQISALNNLSAAQVRTELSTELGRIDAAISTRLAGASYTAPDNANIAAIVADTNELQTDWANGGRLDLILDARASQASVDDIPTNAELTAALGTADDAVLAAIAALNNLSAAQVNAEMVDALTVDIVADSVAVDGNRPTIAQAALMILRFLTEKSVSGTTVTVKKEDGTTSAMTFTLNDGTTPSSITRAS